jgi:hypothetical protein
MNDIQKWKPRLILALDRSTDELQRLKDSNPNNCLVNRRYVPDAEMDQRIRNDPEQAAIFVHNKIVESNGWASDFHIIENEVVQTPDAPHEKIIDYAYHRMSLADQNGYKCALFGFGVGHLHMPENDRFFYWRKFVPVLREAASRGHVLCIHQYGSTSFLLPDKHWYSMRFEYQVADWLFAQIPNLQYVVTELGLNQAVGAPPGTSHSGWRDFMSPNQYNRELIDYAQHPQIQKYSRNHCIGYSIFTHGSTADWASKDIHPEVAGMQANYGSQHQIEMDGGSIVEPLYQVRVIINGLNFRDAPSTEGNIIRVLPNGETLDAIDDVGDPWLYLRDANGTLGYAHRGPNWSYLQKVGEPPPSDLESRVSELESQVQKLNGMVGKLALDVTGLDKRVTELEDNNGNPAPDRRFSESIGYLNQRVVSIVGEPKARVLHAWTTHNGQWETDPSDIYAVEQWAIDLYLKSNSGDDGFGGETHMFARVQDGSGNQIPSTIDFRWPDGVATRVTNSPNGWTNVPITGSFVPERGEEGVWTVSLQSDSEVFGRFSLPSNQHVSLYVVFEV